MDNADEIREEKLPTERPKSSATKAKTHSKEKNSAIFTPDVSLTSAKEENIETIDSKPSKLKKPIVAPTNTVDAEILPTTPGNTSVSAGNSATSVNKHKVKTTKKTKKSTTQQHPAFYFVSTLIW